MQHRSSCSNYGPVLPLSNPVPLGVVRNSKLSVYLVLSTEVLKLMAGILTAIVRPQGLDLLPRLVLHKSLKLLEPAEDLILGLQEVDPGLPGIVINKCHIVLVTTQRQCAHWTAHIRMNQIKDLTSYVLIVGERSLGVLPQSTPPTQLLMLGAELWYSYDDLPELS